MWYRRPVKFKFESQGKKHVFSIFKELFFLHSNFISVWLDLYQVLGL